MRFFTGSALPVSTVIAVAGCQLAFPTREAPMSPDDAGPTADASDAAPSSGDAGADGRLDAWPDESNTGPGAGAALAPSGSLTLSSPGQIVEDIDVQGTVRIAANDVTLRRCRVRSSSPVIVHVDPDVTGVRIEQCEIAGTGAADSIAVQGAASLVRCSVHGVLVALDLIGTGMLIEDSYIWGLEAAGGSSYYAVRMDGNAKNVTLDHNVLDNDQGGSAAVMIDNYAGPIANVTLNANRLSGGKYNYTLYVDGSQGAESVTGVRVTNNRFVKGTYGYGTVKDSTITQSGNVDDVTGAPIDF